MVPEPQEEGEWELERGRGMDIYGSEGVNQERDSMRPVSAQLIESKNLSLVSPRNKLISLCSFSSRQKANFCYSESEPWSGAGVGMIPGVRVETDVDIHPFLQEDNAGGCSMVLSLLI